MNYTGLIIENEVKYDDVNHEFIVDRKNYFDAKGKVDVSAEELLEYNCIYIKLGVQDGEKPTYVFVIKN